MIDIDDFQYDIIVLEAKEMLIELKINFLHVILVNAPYQNHDSQKIRVADNRNPSWYRDLYGKYPSLKRNHTIKSLNRIINKKINYDSIYERMLLDLIRERINQPKGNIDE